MGDKYKPLKIEIPKVEIPKLEVPDYKKFQLSKEAGEIELKLAQPQHWDKSATEKLRLLNSSYNGSSVRATAVDRAKGKYGKLALEEHILSEK